MNATPLPESTSSDNSTTKLASSSPSKSFDEGSSNQDSNEEGPTPPPLSSETQTAVSDSTVATEDIPSSRGENASSPSDHKSSSEGLPEEQPPTVDKDLEHTIMNLNGNAFILYSLALENSHVHMSLKSICVACCGICEIFSLYFSRFAGAVLCTG